MSVFTEINQLGTVSDKGAVLSECGLYRYVLWRGPNNAANPLTFVGLNPSTADATTDDATIRRTTRFARDLGHDGMIIVNLFAFRATKPEDMRKAADPVGPENDRYLVDLPGVIVAAWGTNGGFMGRDAAVKRLLKGRLKCFSRTKDGHPRHPLYLPLDSTLEDFA